MDSNNNLEFITDNWKYKRYIREENNIIPELDGRDLNYKFNSLINVYENLISRIKSNSSIDFNKFISNNIVDPKDIVILSNNNIYQEPLDLTYREFLSNNKNVIPSLVNNKSINLYKSKVELNNAIQNTMNIKPATVLLLYDRYGNVRNPGVELSDDETLLLTSDGIFDSEDIIIDNILRTKIVPRDLNNVFYLDDNGEYILVRNKINKIYELKLNNSTYYFSSHDAMMNNLKKYLLTIVEKVVYEK